MQTVGIATLIPNSFGSEWMKKKVIGIRNSVLKVDFKDSL